MDFKRILSMIVWALIFGCIVVIFFNLTEWYLATSVACLFAAVVGDKLTV